jgi:hypothetical protein
VILFVAATAFIGGLVTQRFRRVALAAICALGGAALALSGLARIFPGELGFLRDPDAAWQAVTAALAWLVLAAAGWATQRNRVDDRSRTR